MAKEVSGFHLQVSLDIGDFFGIPRQELTCFFPEGTSFDSKFTRVDWEPFAAMTKFTCDRIGQKEELIPLGQSYTYERIGSRFTHLMTQFGGGWDRVLWATKHFFNPRLIRGYEMSYEKLGHNHFRLRSSFPESYVGCEPYFWLFTGVWTGGNKISNLKHEILSLDITPHTSVGEIRFAERNRVSRVAFNAPWSRFRTWRELRKDNHEQQKQVEELDQVARNLQQSVEAVSDAVYRVGKKELIAENAAAMQLQASEGFNSDQLLLCHHSPQTGMIQIGKQTLEVRSDEPDGLLVLRDRTQEESLLREAERAPQRVRKQTGERVYAVLGHELDRVSERIHAFCVDHPTHDAAKTLQQLSPLVDQCKSQAKALIDHRYPSFENEDHWREALEKLCEEYRILYSFEIVLQGHLSPEPETKGGWNDWFLLCNEAFRNAFRHSGGHTVTLAMQPGRIQILDDGSGLRESFQESEGLGCESMRARAKDLGWNMHPAPAPENGWILEFSEAQG